MISRQAAIFLVLVTLAFSEAMTPLIDSTGSLHRSAIPSSTAEAGGIIALINPTSSFSFVTGSDSNEELQGVFAQWVDSCTLLLSPGANTIPTTSSTGTGSGSGSNPVRSGYGCAAASVAAGVVIVDGFTTSDLFDADSDTVEEEWRDSRLGRSLCSIFAAHAAADLTASQSKKVALMICVKGDVTSLKQQQAVMRTVEGLYKEVMETKRLLAKSKGEEEEYSFGLEDVYDVMLVKVQSVEDAKKVCRWIDSS